MSANLLWFAVAHFAVTVAAIVVFAVLERFGVIVPSMGVSIGVMTATSWMAGDRMARTRSNWTSKERHWLAVGYSVIASVLVVPLAPIAMLAGVLINDIPFVAFGAWFEQVAPFLLVGLLIGLALNYVISRFTLSQVARQRGLK